MKIIGSVIGSFLLLLLLLGCKASKSSATADSLSVDSASIDTLNEEYSKYSNWKTETDSTYNGWRVIIRSAENGVKVKDSAGAWEDRSFFVSIYKNGKKLFDNEEITTASLIEGNDNPNKYLLFGGLIDEITNSTVYIEFHACLPETDCGFYKIYAFSDDATMTGYFDIGELDGFPVETMYLCLTHELTRKSTDTKSLHKIASKYCTESLVSQLEKNDYMDFLPSKITKQRLNDYYIDSSELVNSGGQQDTVQNKESEMQRYKVVFRDKKTDKAIDSLTVDCHVNNQGWADKIERIIK